MTKPKAGNASGLDIKAGAEPALPVERGPAKAVAIKDTSQSGTLPRLVASGRGAIAEQILQIAWANNIKVREDADLIEVLSAIDVESHIPIEAFAAVAEILSYVYRANAGEIPLDDPQSPKTEDLEAESPSSESPNDVPTRPA